MFVHELYICIVKGIEKTVVHVFQNLKSEMVQERLKLATVHDTALFF